jgi:hypothetical protein
MNPDLIKPVGEALYGPQWLIPMSADLEISVDEMLRMTAGEIAIPDGTTVQLLRIVILRIDKLQEVISILEFAIPRPASSVREVD